MKRNNLVGRQFGMLTVVSEAGRAKDRHILYECICDCGNHKIVNGNSLLRGMTHSCGCYKRVKHGGSSERLYKIWLGMKGRCVRDKHYVGITVCDEWQDYAVFKEWAYSNGYDENAPQWKCTIDRIDVNGNYEPDNCRWVDESVQMFNRRKAKSKLGVRGVYYRDKDKKYYAMINKDGKQIYLGCFDRVGDAVKARREGEMEYYGMVLEA